jgi:hypothetical protein
MKGRASLPAVTAAAASLTMMDKRRLLQLSRARRASRDLSFGEIAARTLLFLEPPLLAPRLRLPAAPLEMLRERPWDEASSVGEATSKKLKVCRASIASCTTRRASLD